MGSSSLPIKARIKLLVDSIDGDENINEKLSKCKNSEAMLDILLDVSSQQNLNLTRDDLTQNPPIRDWVWWKNKEALVNLGDDNLRYQGDSSGKTRWDSWTISFFKFLRIWR